MADGMRGTRLGMTSYEVDPGVLAPRLLTTFICTDGHEIELPFSTEADEIPDTWDCVCGLAARRADLSPKAHSADQLPTRTPKTHFDQLMERRTKADLQELLSERMTLLRAPKKAS